MKGAAVATLLLLAPAPLSAGPIHDPDGLAGEWSYRTSSNCGALGLGRVTFTRRPDGSYLERGSVRWEHSGLVVRWWGVVRLDRDRRTLSGWLDNSLGDRVDGHWTLDAIPPRRLAVTWDQTNGCRGTGVATRR